MSLELKHNRLGLIAGNGKFPLLFVNLARQKENLKIIAVAVRGDTSRILNSLVDKVYWVKPGELGKMLEYFQAEKIDKVVMAGQVNPNNLFNKDIALDDELAKLFQNIKDRKADTIFNAVANRLKAFNINLVDPTPYLTSLIASKGVLTDRAPSEKEWEDIRFGASIAKVIGHLDIGQTVVVKEKAILAIEAMEGTDRTILRGGGIGKGDVIVVKMSKPNQDMRFDVPVVGLRTIKFLIKAKACCLAIEAEKTLVLDRKPCIELADKKKISVVAI